MPPASEQVCRGDHVVFQPEFVEFGGEERVILSLCRELQAQGKPHVVLCYRDQIGLEQYAEWPLRVVQLAPASNPVARVLSLRRCLQQIARQAGPVPMLFNIQSAYHAGLGADAPYHLRIPDTYSLLDFAPADAPPAGLSAMGRCKSVASQAMRHAATRRGIRGANRLVTNTVALREEMRGLYGRAAEVIYLGGFGTPLAQTPQRSASPIELLTVSRLQTSKRIDWILHALADIDASHPAQAAWRLHIAGSGPDGEALKALTAELGLRAKVVFHGFVSDAQLQALYDRSHVFLMPARQGYGLPAIEALYRRMGLVVSDGSGVVEILGNTDWVAIANQGQPGFTQAVAQMLQRVTQAGFFEQPLPDLPMERTWAIRLMQHVQW